MSRKRRAFTLVELVMILAVLVVIAAALFAAMKQRRNADGMAISINNVRSIIAACAAYRADSNDRVPMRGARYSNGQITTGWDTWSAFGKNCDIYWLTSSSGNFDESAYGRFLNPYLQAIVAPVPVGYLNAGSGATWTFNDGTPSSSDRARFQVKVCRSPGDVATYQRNWPAPTPGRTGYDDVGTSYHLNMKWWSTPGGPSNFTSRFAAGTQAINSANPGLLGVRAPSTFVWIHDQIAGLASQTSGTFAGEFGGNNMSVVGYLDGRAAYIPILNNAMTGPGYSFGITW